jgi:hypothetical protein
VAGRRRDSSRRASPRRDWMWSSATRRWRALRVARCTSTRRRVSGCATWSRTGRASRARCATTTRQWSAGSRRSSVACASSLSSMTHSTTALLPLPLGPPPTPTSATNDSCSSGRAAAAPVQPSNGVANA